MGATGSKAPAITPAQPSYEIMVPMRFFGFRDSCGSCCWIADKLLDAGPTGDFQEVSDLIQDLLSHIGIDHGVTA